MENSYGIGVANRYALFLDDESDPLEKLNLKEQEKELKKKCKVPENKEKADPPKRKPANVQKKVEKENTVYKVQDNKREDVKPNHQWSNVESEPERTYNKFNNEDREKRNNRGNREDRPYNGPSENTREREYSSRREHIGGEIFENRNRERGERGGKPLGNEPAGPRGPRRNFDDRREKRESDWQSGSGKAGINKRDVADADNWGSYKDVIEEVDAKPNDAEHSWNDDENPETTTVTEPKEENEVEGTAPVEEPVEEPKQLTLDEWKAQRAGRMKPQYNIRKAGEGEDPRQWKKMYELRKKENESESEDEEYDPAEYPQRVGRQKHVLDIDIQFNNRHGGGRGRGQRSGPRDGNRSTQRGGGGGPSGDRPKRRYRDEQADERIENRRAPKVDDERDFPSLGN